MTISLIITTYNRPNLLVKCLESILKLDEKPNYLYLVDDCSDSEMVDILLDFHEKHWNSPMQTSFHRKHNNKGIKDSLIEGFEWALIYKGSDLVINLDGDAIVKPDFIGRLKDLKTRFPDRIISGFNCNHPKNPVLFDGGDYVERKHANGINYCIDRGQYERIVRPALLSPTGNWDFSSTHDKNFIITKPSVCDHLGWDCSTMNHGVNGTGDRACDF